MTTNRSTEELDMRAIIADWGRLRWPGCRVINEMAIEDCRIDMAFVTKSHVAGIEIKSSKDTLKRWPGQARKFSRRLPELWVAFAPKWTGDPIEADLPAPLRHRIGQLMVDAGEGTITTKTRHIKNLDRWYSDEAVVDETMTSPMLDLLWRDELAALCAQHRIKTVTRTPIKTLTISLARQLTGNQIIRGVSKALRAREFRHDPPSDPPIDPRPAKKVKPKEKELL